MDIIADEQKFTAKRLPINKHFQIKASLILVSCAKLTKLKTPYPKNNTSSGALERRQTIRVQTTSDSGNT